jgi:hypothetical protein
MGRLSDLAFLKWDSSSAWFGSPAPADLVTAGIVDPDELFAELDNLEIAAGSGQWRVEVFSISDHDDHRWIQLVVRGESEHMVTLRVLPGTRLEDALPSLSAWLADGAEGSHIIDATAADAT